MANYMKNKPIKPKSDPLQPPVKLLRKEHKVRVAAGNRPEDRSGARLGGAIGKSAMASPQECEAAMDMRYAPMEYHKTNIERTPTPELRAVTLAYAQHMVDGQAHINRIERALKEAQRENEMHRDYLRVLGSVASANRF